MDTSIKVSVLVMTYNHIDFIAQALQSVLEQQVCFDYEILISEDCSTDGTREAVLAYQQEFPQKIRLLLSEQNIHSNAIVARGVSAARGQYIALLDGDDYWTSPYKLQKQVDFLDNHPECSVCFHNAKVVYEDGNQHSWNWSPESQREFLTLEDIWIDNPIAACSTMFRCGIFGDIPKWYDELFPITDWPLHILNAEHGKIGYINEVMGAYRYHHGGLYSPLSEMQKLAKTLSFYKTMNANLEYKYQNIINVAISKYFLEWAEEYLKRDNIEQAKLCFTICLMGTPINRFISLTRIVRLAWRILYRTISMDMAPSIWVNKL